MKENNRDPRIPEAAKKVFEGVRSTIYQWDQELYDGSSTPFEIIRFLDWAFVVGVTRERKILLTKQEQPARNHFFYSLPWGSFDHPDEDPLGCAKRELFEETGYGGGIWEPWLVTNGTYNVIAYTHFYIAHDIEYIWGQKPDAGEKIELLLLDFDEFLAFSENPYFSHWPLLPILLWSLLHREKYDTLKRQFHIS